MPNEKTVATPTDLHATLDRSWSVVRDLRGGTLAMRDAGETYLPREKKESKGNYERRVARSFLFDAYSDSVDKLVSRPFSRSVKLSGDDDLAEQLKTIQLDTDRDGTSLTVLAAELLTIAIDHGMAHLLVDYPRVSGETPSVGEERDLGIHPTLIPIKPCDVIGWQASTDDAGDVVLLQVRISETVEEPAAIGYDSVSVDQIRVLTREGWEIHREFARVVDEKTVNVWEKVDDGEWANLAGGEIPFLTAYLSREGFMRATPALMGLAWMNVAHWQSESDQRSILHFARACLLFTSGITQDEIKEQGGLTLGPTSAMSAANPAAKAGIVESNGAAIESGAKDLAALEQKMQVLGLQPFFKLTGGSTATEKKIDESRTETQLQSWIKVIENLVASGYEVAGRWIDADVPDGFRVDIYSDFVASSMIDNDVQSLHKMRLSGNIDLETFLSEIKRRGLFGDGVTEEEIMARLAAEGPSLAGAGGGFDDGEA